MDINTQNSSGMMNGMPPVNSVGEENKGGNKTKAIISLIALIIVIIIVGLYFMGNKEGSGLPEGEYLPATEESGFMTDDTSMMEASDLNQATAPSSPSDDVNDIVEDLEAQLEDVDYSF